MEALRYNDLQNCNFCKTVLMLCVVLCHSAAFFGGGWFSICPLHETVAPLRFLATWTGTFHVSGFTLVSGYIYYYLRYEQGKYSEFAPFVKNKAKRLLVPYAAVSLLWVIPVSQAFYHLSPLEIFTRFGMGEGPMQLWFLLMLFFVFITVYCLIDNKLIGGGKLAILLFIIGKVGAVVLPNLFQVFTAFTYTLFFWIGFEIRKHCRIMSNRQLLVYGLGALAVNVVSYYINEFACTGGGMSAKIMGMGFDEASRISGAVMAFLGLNFVARHVDWENNGLFKRLSRVSFPIYLFHQQIIYVVVWNLNGKLNPYVIAVLNFAVSIVVSVIITEILMKHKRTRCLIGAK